MAIKRIIGILIVVIFLQTSSLVEGAWSTNEEAWTGNEEHEMMTKQSSRTQFSQPRAQAQALETSSWTYDDGGMSDYKAPTKRPNKSDENWQWCLLTIDGNATIIQLRLHDFIRYLRMNVASLIGSDYDSVIFNTISYTPEILVNLTLDWHGRSKRIVSTLTHLASNNDTLLDLSGTHYNLTDFLPWSAILAPKPVAPLGNPSSVGGFGGLLAGTAKEIETLIFVCVIAAIVFIVLASLIFATCQCLSRRSQHNNSNNDYWNSKERSRKMVRSDESNRNLLSNTSHYSLDDLSSHTDGTMRRSSREPRLIYSQSFSDGLQQQQQSGHRIPANSYTTVDENLAPLATFEGEEYTPRFVHTQSQNRFPLRHPHRPEEVCSDIVSIRRMPGVVQHRKNSDLLSDSQSDILNTRRRISPNGYFPNTTLENPDHADPDMISTETSTMEIHNAAQPHPSYQPHPQPKPSPNFGQPLHHSHHHQHRLSRGGYLPMEPVFQTVTVDTTEVRPPSLPSRPGSRINTMPASKSYTQSLSSFRPDPPVPAAPTPEEIERDVKIILHNLGINEAENNTNEVINASHQMNTTN